MIGAMELSEKAAVLERAAKEKDEETIEKEHDEAMNMYERVVHIIKANPLIEVSKSEAEDEIFEFLPDRENEE